MFLNDKQLKDKLQGATPIVTSLMSPPSSKQPHAPQRENVNEAVTDEWDGPDSPIQPCSIDLHVGQILIPGTAEGKSGSVGHARKELALGFGHTAVIVTAETVRMPNTLGALGFPPSSLSFKGLLMTNHGHIDPGYRGALRFAVVNIGRESIILRAGDPIVTLLVFELDSPVAAGYAARRNHGGPAGGPSQQQVDILSNDFLDVEKRSKAAAERAVKDAGLKYNFWSLVLPLVIALLTTLLTLHYNNKSLQSKLDSIEKVLGMTEPKSRLDDIELIIQQLNKRKSGSTDTVDLGAPGKKGEN